MRCFLDALAREALRRDQELLVLMRASQAEEQAFSKVLRSLDSD